MGGGATPPNGHDDFTRAGENQLSSSELFHGELAKARLIIATPWHSKLARPDSKLFCNTSDTNRSADKQTRPPLALFHVLGQPVKLLGLLVDRAFPCTCASCLDCPLGKSKTIIVLQVQ